jgi:hypothetical protein
VKFAPAGSWVATATISSEIVALNFQGDDTEVITCHLRVPGRVVATTRETLVHLNNGASPFASLSLTGAFTLPAAGTVDVFCSASGDVDATADLTLVRVDSLT